MKQIPQHIREQEVDSLCKGTIYSFSSWGGTYKGNRTPLIMRCELHGEWSCYLPDFMKGSRCAVCKKVKRISKNERLKQIKHKCADTPYTFVKWIGNIVNNRSRVLMNCEHHGEWECVLDSIVTIGTGCPACSKNGFDPLKPAVIYVLKSDTLIKVGITNNMNRRLVELKRHTPFSFDLILLHGEKVGRNAREIEKVIHERFESANLSGFNGATEWLKWNPEIPLWFEYFTQTALAPIPARFRSR